MINTKKAFKGKIIFSNSGVWLLLVKLWTIQCTQVNAYFTGNFRKQWKTEPLKCENIIYLNKAYLCSTNTMHEIKQCGTNSPDCCVTFSKSAFLISKLNVRTSEDRLGLFLTFSGWGTLWEYEESYGSSPKWMNINTYTQVLHLILRSFYLEVDLEGGAEVGC